VTYDELKERVNALSETLDGISVEDMEFLLLRIELRQLLNRMDIAVVPQLSSGPDVDIDQLLLAVERDIHVEEKRANLITQISKVVGFVKNVVV
jgi:hypothetical protein